LAAKRAKEAPASTFISNTADDHSSAAGCGCRRVRSLNKIRDAIADDAAGFTRMVRKLDSYDGLSDESMLKRMPRGFAEDHPAAKWLRYQSFTSGRALTDSQVTGADLPQLLEREFKGLLPLVRWINRALGY
jgi:uncharacterized protein (DUF2461 family)